SAGDRFEAAVAAAAAGWSAVRFHDDVSDVPRVAGAAVDEPAAEDEAAADAGRDDHAQHVRDAPPGPAPVFGHGQADGVVVDPYRNTREQGAEPGAQREAPPAGDVERRDDAGGPGHRAAAADADAGHPAGEGRDHGEERLPEGFGVRVLRGRRSPHLQNGAVGGHAGGGQFGAADVHRQDHSPPAEENTSSDAVNPCTWLCPPTGPTSPAAKNPATPTGPSVSRSASGSWSAVPSIAEPRQLQMNSSAPSTRPSCCRCASSTSYRSSSAVAASRTWKRTVRPISTMSPMATASRSGSMPMTPRIRKSPRSCRSAYSSMASPICSPAATSSRSSSSRSVTMSSSRDRAGCPASSSSRFSSARVTTMLGPIGRQPWLTRVVTLTEPLIRTPMAPSV